MKTLYNYSNYGNDLRLTSADAARCYHPGKCDSDILEVSKKPYVKTQLKALNPEKLTKELSEYGAWDEEQLQDHEQNLQRWLWISASDIIEGR